jgi:eukaryotic-like serine/threonine-protein kinase
VTSDRWQQIEQLYHAALELEGGQRTAFLTQACAGDDALRQEVESLLAQGAGSQLEAPALEVAARSLAEDGGRSLLGRRIGSYQILSLVGAGGMGEVYEAHDSKLGRNVAIKVLPAEFVHDADRLSRFQREARMLASLSHPNIATIHGLEQSDGAHYLVMELVPGKTLAERLTGGALGLEEALKIAGQIAEALEAAHAKGVIHRDLKPANVKVTPEGRVKVLDFGLAKAFAGAGAPDLSQPTLTLSTEDGRILGTPAYMSPEQARGKPVDKRTDIWAFGCVLYEMLTARQAFPGATVSDAIAAVLGREPDWQALPASVPVKIRDLLRRCLQKDSQRRLHDIADARIEIEEAQAAPPAPAMEVRTRWPGVLLWSGVFLLAAVIAGLAIWKLKPSSATTPGVVSRVAITLPPGELFAGFEAGVSVALSPDGTRLAYVARRGGVQQVYLRSLEGLEAKPVPGSEGGAQPFFSPDSQWLGFFAGGKLKKISVAGGESLSIADATDPRGASWGSDGKIMFVPRREGVVWQVSAAGGTPQPLTQMQGSETSHRWPEFLPGGQAVLFAAGIAGSNWDAARVAVQLIGPGQRRELVPRGTNPHYASSGHLIYALGGTVMALPFDGQRLEVKGPPSPVIESVLQLPLSGAAQYSFSATGSMVYVPASVAAAQRRLVWVNRSGSEVPLAAPARGYRHPRLSPDGKKLAVAIEGQETHIWLYDLARETLTRLTIEGSLNNNPNWTPDGGRIIFGSNREGAKGSGAFWQLADGSGGAERLTDAPSSAGSWSSAGRVLVFDTSDPATGRDIYTLQPGGRQPLIRTPFNEGSPTFSADGRWLAFASDASGRSEIYVQPYPGPGGRLQISTGGGTEPVWSRNGRELFYRSGDKLMAVDIDIRSGFSAGKPKSMFQGLYQPTPVVEANYDVAPDGRFLMIKPGGEEQAPTQVNVVLNWFEELKRLAPVSK